MSIIPPQFAINVAASGTVYTLKPSSLNFSAISTNPEVLPAHGPPVIHNL